MADVIPFFGARIVGILDFPIYCAASRFDFPVYRASRYEFSHLPRVTLCSLRQAQSAPIALFDTDISDPFLDTVFVRE